MARRVRVLWLEASFFIAALAAIWTLLIVFLIWLHGATKDEALVGLYTLLVAGAFGWWFWNSIYVLEEDEALEVFFFGTNWHTYANGSLYGRLNKETRRKYLELDIQGGHFGDWLFLPYGIFRAIRFSTGNLSIVLVASGIFTAPTDENDPAMVAFFPRLNLRARPSLEFRFLSIRQLVTSLKLPHHGDLTKECKIPVFGGKENETYQGSRLEYYLAMSFQSLVAEGIRKAGTYFNWEGKALDIVKNKQYLEIITLFVLAQAGSNMSEAGILQVPRKYRRLRKPDPTLQDFIRSKVDVNNFWPVYMRTVDLNIEELIPTSSEEDSNEINKPFRAILTARERVNQAQAQLEELYKAGQGRAKALSAVIEAARRAGVEEAEVALTLDMLRERTGEFKINQFGGDVTSLLEELISKKKGTV